MPGTSPSRQAPRNIALPWWEAGCSVIPIKRDGTKQPMGSWKRLQAGRMSAGEVEAVWRPQNQPGVAVACGKVSGNLEMLELEGGYTGADVLEAIEYAAVPYGMDGLWRSLISGAGYIEWTPSGGLHLLYRIADHDVPGNEKIAQFPDPVTRNLKTKAETRGEGGYVIVAPTPGACHPSGEAWEALFQGTPESIPTLTWHERSGLHNAIRDVLDETPPPPPQVEKRATLLGRIEQGGLRPGDDFNARASWHDILIPHGWHSAGNRGTETLWVRPGKDNRDGHSASTGYAQDADRLYVWSTSAGLPSETPLSKFYVYTHLNHGGDWSAATRELSRLGYGGDGSPVPPPAASIVQLQSQGDVPAKRSMKESIQYTDVGNTDYMDIASNGKIKYNSYRKKWFVYEDGVWALDPQGRRVKMMVEQWARERLEYAEEYGTAKDVKECMALLGARRINAAFDLLHGRALTRPSDWDRDTNLLNLRNGTFNLETMQLQEHNPADMLTKRMGVAYDPHATAPNFERFLAEAVPDEGERRYLQRMVGYSLTGDPVERALMVLHGPGGTGKSTFIETIAELFDEYGTTATDQVFRAKREGTQGPTNDLMNLQGARYVSMSELDYGASMDESLIKRMTGRDRITSRHMYEENQTWTPQCVIWLATNHHFKINGDDGAIWDRIKVVKFHVRAAKKDEYLARKLKAELAGIFNWALAGLREYREIGLCEPEGVVEAIAQYRDEQDDVYQFRKAMLDDGVMVEGVKERIKKTQAYDLYLEWCKREGNRYPLGQKRFNLRWEALGYHIVKSGNLFWQGIGLPAGSWLVGVGAST